jgi:hypothetical protein
LWAEPETAKATAKHGEGKVNLQRIAIELLKDLVGNDSEMKLG